MQTNIPIFVDLDKTLIKTDVLSESIISLLKKNLFYALLMPYWFLRHGLVYFKRQVALQIQPDPALLAYNQALLDYILSAKKQGSSLILATAADKLIADKVAEYLNIFEGVIATDGGLNLSGSNKLAAIRAYCPTGDFIYAGDAFKDLPIWRAAAGAIYVGRSQRLKKEIEASTKIVYQCSL